MSSSRLRFYQRALALMLSASFLAACQGGAAAPPPFNTGKTAPPFGVTSLETTNPTALTPLYVHTQGVNPGQPVTATFTGTSGFAATLNAVRIADDGTVVVPVPLPQDPKTGASGSARLSMVLTQGAHSTAPVAVDVQDLPQLSDFGTSLGDVSRTYLNYEAMALGKQLGALRAMQASPVNHVDTHQEQADVTALLQAVIRSRNDVDRIIVNNNLQIPAGTINGRAVNFDRNALTMMDRMIGTYLVSLGPVYQPPSGASGSQHARHPAATSSGGGHKSTSALDPKTLTTALEWIKHINDVGGPVAGYRSAANSDSNFEKAIGYVGATASVIAFGAGLFVAGAPLAAGAATVAAVLSGVSVALDLYHVASDVGTVMSASSTPGQVSNAYADMGRKTIDAIVDGTGAALAGQTAKVVLNGLSTGANVAWQSAALISTAAQQYFLKSPEQDRQTSLNADGQLLTPLQSNLGFADVSGDFTVMNSQGTTLSGLSGVQIGNPPFTYGIADPFGHYDVYIPTGTPFDSSGQPLNGFDPVTGTFLSTQPIDLSGAKPGDAIKAPPMSGTCNDSDANAPDSDDPDCD